MKFLRLKFGQNFEAEYWSTYFRLSLGRFFRLELIKILKLKFGRIRISEAEI